MMKSSSVKRELYIHSWRKKFAYTLQNLQNVDYFTKYEGSYKMHAIVYLVLLTWKRYFT